MRGQPSEETIERASGVFNRILSQSDDTVMDYGLKAYALVLSLEAIIAEEVPVIDFVAIHKARTSVRVALAREFQTKLLDRSNALTKQMHDYSGGEFIVDSKPIGQRHLRNEIFQYLDAIRDATEEQKAAADLALNHFHFAKGMSDKKTALLALASMVGEGKAAREQALKELSLIHI